MPPEDVPWHRSHQRSEENQASLQTTHSDAAVRDSSKRLPGEDVVSIVGVSRVDVRQLERAVSTDTKHDNSTDNSHRKDNHYPVDTRQGCRSVEGPVGSRIEATSL